MINLTLPIKALLVAGALIIGFGIRYVCKSKPVDIAVEKLAEEIVKEETGYDINMEEK